MKSSKLALTAVSIAAAMALAACGGGGGGGNASSPTTPPAAPPSPTTGNVTTPQYAANSAEQTIFTTLNQYRQQCGFPALTENTLLDKATANHSSYMAQANAVSDSETAGKAGYTGVTFSDRAAAVGFPSGSVAVGGVSNGFWTTPALTETGYGQNLLYGWISGVYHIGTVVWPVTQVGVGYAETTFNGAPQAWGALTLANLQSVISNGPLTFPCQGTTGVPYKALGETPTPPNTSGAWGTPIGVAGNPQDTIVLQTASITDTSTGTPASVQLLDSSKDPNKLIPAYEAVAYPSSPLSPNTSYAVTITGTVNGVAFSRSFTFTTGNVVG
ncbi:CAP domain-containing protein [Paraburkholderia sp. SIMBA_054]|uniref:CAP domain-containing protein n=1 Tax=Paraburkholderia sp. SIMBA_054 TaxID=3085795 RepID=UPI00397824D3